MSRNGLRSTMGWAALLAVAVAIGAQEPPKEDSAWALLGRLEGTWRGEIDGLFGPATGLRSYERVLDGRYLLERHSSVNLPQEKNAEGDHHRELGIYSWDGTRETIVQRTFNVEGFVTRSACEHGQDRIVCTSEEVESGPGVRSRMTLEWVDAHRFEETFELSFSPEQDLRVYFEIRWTRVPDLSDVTRR